VDWAGLGLKDPVLSWLRAAAGERYIRDKRLDPFATSMRDFDDVTPNLQALREGKKLGIKDAGQRLADLKAAGLSDATGTALTSLGEAVLAAWEKYGVATDEKGDELARLFLLAIEAGRLKHPTYAEYFEYWKDLRAYFEPMELINNWDALYALNYLDLNRGGFAPGASFRDEGSSVAEIEFDLGEFAKKVGSNKSLEGAERIEVAIGGKVPRGRHRSTMCMAFEICVGGKQSASLILEDFGFPKKPRIWTPFNDAQKATIYSIISDYDLEKGQEQKIVAVATHATTQTAIAIANPDGLTAHKSEPSLPENIDFSKVLVNVPPLKQAASSNATTKNSVGKKIDHQQKAKTNDAVGKLGESFAFQFESWRLKNHPELLKKLHHVSAEDDTVGYDIASFELDGTPRFVEVKGTLGPMESRFFLSANELACAQEKGPHYVVLRVANLNEDPKCCEIRYPFEGKVNLSPATYSVSFSSSSTDQSGKTTAG